MNITPHFDLEEFTQSDTATRLSIDQTPTPDVMAALLETANRMEAVRSVLGNKPIHISSGYRSLALNKAIGGAANSAHITGHAVDFTCPGYGTPLSICKALRTSKLQFDQLILEGTWVHISFKPMMRGMVLTAHFSPGKPTLYTEGLA